MEVTSIAEKVERPVGYLTEIARRYPGLWKQVDRLRVNRDKIYQNWSAGWPKECYLPLFAAMGIAKAFGAEQDHLRRTEGASIATLGSWRIAKDIYIFDESVFEELWNTPMEGNIPIDVLHRLPTWCGYIAFPAPRDMLHGFFVHLNQLAKNPVLVHTMDFADKMTHYPLELREGCDLLQCLQFMRDKNSPENITPGVTTEQMKKLVEPLLSLTLYLCSTSAEIRARDPLRGLRRESYSKKTKKGLRTFVPDEPRVWEVAFRIGATLRAASTATIGSDASDASGTHASPRPHIRRAHWHSFWTGPKAAVGKPEVPPREIIVKWIPPIAVAMGPDGEAIPTVHRVTR